MSEPLRIVRNIVLLLEGGMFPGSHGGVVAEGLAFARNLATEIEAAQPAPAEPPTPLKKARKGSK